MSRMARYGRAVALEGQGDELAAVLLTAAENLGGDPGCSNDVAAAMALVEDWQMIELELLGGKGPASAHG